jgi:catechol 2,3-dioxygenase-like lactoylglutathione lyase family enzyme
MSKTKMIKGFAYVSHQVSDLDQAREFYEGILGLKSTGSYAGTWEEYDVDGIAFAVWKASDITPPYFRKLKVTGSLAFEVEDIEVFSKKLKKAGVQFLQEPTDNEGHCKTAYIADPDGNIITLHELLEK